MSPLHTRLATVYRDVFERTTLENVARRIAEKR